MLWATMTSLWARYALPRLTDLVMRGSAQAKDRAKFVPLAAGTVLEVGAGSGLNIRFYGAAVKRLYALDPSKESWRWTLCTIPDPDTALKEMKRVLKAEGQLIFIEHGRSPEPAIRAWQDRINPVWRRVAGGAVPEAA